MLRISSRQLTACLFITVVSMYAFSQLSLANAVSMRVWVIMWIICGGICLVNHVSHDLMAYRNTTVDELLMVLMLIIVIAWKNWDFRYGNPSYEYFFVTITFLYIICKKYSGWEKYFNKIMILVGCFYALMTILSLVSASFYENVVFPLISQYNTMYSQTYTAGFTSHYSANGMYLAIGLCVSIASYFFTYTSNKSKFKWLCLMLLIGGALLITSKRAPVLCIAIGFIVTYIIFNGDKPLSRYFKLFIIVIAVMVIYSIACVFIPELGNFVERFVTQAQKGDITTQRIYLWAEGFAAFLNKPLTGNGWSWFKYHNSYGLEYHVHNVYLQWLTETGVIGCIPFFAFTILTFSRAARLLSKAVKGKIYLPDEIVRNLSLSMLYQAFFIPFCFQGTAFYEPEVLLPYIMLSAVANKYWSDYLGSGAELK